MAQNINLPEGFTLKQYRQQDGQFYIPPGSLNLTQVAIPGTYAAPSSVYASYYDAVVGSGLDLAAGTVTFASIAAAISAYPNGRILLMAETFNENITLTSSNENIVIEGKGRSTLINGTLTLNGGAIGCLIKGLKIGGNIVASSDSKANCVRECWQSTGSTCTDTGTVNSWLVIQE
jgi:hypothetical protein